jgi:sorbitol-specific phosphotransferase system component IIBC
LGSLLEDLVQLVPNVDSGVGMVLWTFICGVPFAS